MMNSIAVLEKPTPRMPLADWHGRVWELKSTCDTKRQEAWKLRNDAIVLRNETGSKARWDVYNTNCSLTDRVTEITRWRETLQKLYDRLEKEMEMLRHEKSLTEAEINFLDLNLTVVNECLTQRDQRGGSDLCNDQGQMEIKKELKVIESLKHMLTQKCQNAWEELNVLEELKFRLKQDLSDKDEAIRIDQGILTMDSNSQGISLKRDPLRVLPTQVSFECWEEQCVFMKTKLEKELEEAQAIRESMFVPRERARNDLKAQNEATNYALRKRIYETRRICEELQWQRLNMQKNLEKLHEEVNILEFSTEDKVRALKLAHTRAEKRLYRPGAENCKDEPGINIELEVSQLNEAILSLKDKYEESKILYNRLEAQLIMVDEELANKEHALNVDLRGLDLRNKLSRGNDIPPPDTQTDRNLAIYNVSEKPLPP